MPPPRKDTTPTFDAYFKAAHDLSVLVRRTYDNPGSVKRADMLKALKKFESVDFKAM